MTPSGSLYICNKEDIMDDNTIQEKVASHTPHDNHRGISTVIIFCFVLAGFHSEGVVSKAAFFGTAAATVGASIAIYNLRKRRAERERTA